MSDISKLNEEFLGKVQHCLESRNIAYGDAFPLFEDVAERWRAIFKGKEPNTFFTSSQIVLAMIELKIVRFVKSGYKDKDALVDIAGYSAILHNLASNNESENNDT